MGWQRGFSPSLAPGGGELFHNLSTWASALKDITWEKVKAPALVRGGWEPGHTPSLLKELFLLAHPHQVDQCPFFYRGGDKHLRQVLLPQAAEGSPDRGQEGTRASGRARAGQAALKSSGSLVGRR